MLHAALHNKLRGLTPSEDELTSSVFGPLEYLPVDPVWRLFASLWAASRASAASPRSTASPEAFSLAFWPSWSGTPGIPQRVEPDLLICFTGRSFPATTLLIEVKWAAPASGVDQLARQRRAYHSRPEFVGHDLRQIYLTKHPALGWREIRKAGVAYRTCRDPRAPACRAQEPPPEWPESIAHVSWHRFAGVLRRLSAAGEHTGAFERWADHVAAFLDRMGVIGFGGFAPKGAVTAPIRARAVPFWRRLPGFGSRTRSGWAAPVATREVPMIRFDG